MVNFLYDTSQAPHISASELYQWFGVSASTEQAKSKLVRDALKMHQLDPEWGLASLIDRSPLTWMLSVNGILMDIRQAPLGAQVEAYRKGLIPYIPGHKEDSEAIAAPFTKAPPSPRKTSPSKSTQTTISRSASPEALQALYVLDVALLS